jgi:OsmC-like protein
MVFSASTGGNVMTPDELRAMQAPLKERYRADPARAVVTLRAAGDISARDVSLDFRGTLGVAKDAPVGFREIRLGFDLRTAAPPEQVAKLLQLTERYCVVFQTLAQSPPLKVTHRVG